MSRICVYLEAEDQGRLMAEAAEQGVSLSAYIRNKLIPPPIAPGVCYGVKITGSTSKIEEIKAVRSVTRWGLVDAKIFVERDPVSKVLTSFVDTDYTFETGYIVTATHENLSRAEALTLIQRLAKQGVVSHEVTLSVEG